MTNNAIMQLHVQRNELASHAIARVSDVTEWSEGDLTRLLDLCDEQMKPALLDALDNEGIQFAQAGGRLDVRLESVERIADALGSAIDEMFATDESVRKASRDALRLARRNFIMAIAKGFQSAIERFAYTERENGQIEQRRLRAIQHINAAVNSSLNVDETLGTCAMIIAQEVHADLCAIFTRESPNELVLRATNHPPEEILGHYVVHIGEPITGLVGQKGVPMSAEDVDSALGIPIESQIFDRPYKGIFVVPIIYFGNDESILEGAITFLTEQPHTYTPEEIHFMELSAGLLAMGLELSSVYRRTDEIFRNQLARMDSLQRISATVATSFDLERVLTMIVTQAVQMSGVDQGIILQIDSDDGSLLPIAHHHVDVPGLKDLRIAMDECCAGRALRRCDRVWALDCMHTDQSCILQRLHVERAKLHSSLALPLLSKGQIEGILLLLSSRPQIQPAIQMELMETLMNEAAIAIESTRMYLETRKALEKKSHLLQEMHHRVKNNLLSIAAILRMEKRRTTSAEAALVLAESVSRIDSMAATHELLSHEEEIGSANIGEIAKKLMGVVSAHLVPPTLKVDFDIRASSSISVHSQSALALALILNELLANAIEHGFADHTAGRIKVGIWEQDDRVHLVVADNGGTLDPSLNLTQLSSLGLPLVRDMARDQLHGSFSLRCEQLPEFLRDNEQDVSLWTLAELIFSAEKERIFVATEN